MKIAWRALLAMVLGAVMVPFLSQTAEADSTYTLTGRVTGLNGSGAEVGIGDVQVDAWSPGSANTDTVDLTDVTAADGTYSITVPRGGDYTYLAYCDGSCSGYGDGRIDDVAVTGDTTQDLHLSLLTTLTLTVHDSAGDPVARSLDVSASSAAGLSDGITVTGPSGDGAYTLTNVAADSSIYVDDDPDGDPVYAGWSSSAHPGFIADSASPQAQTITLEDWTGIRARAATPDGTPLDNVRYNVFEQDPTSGEWDQGLQKGPLRTGDDGRMSEQVDPGANYKVCFYDDDYDVNARSQRYADACWEDAASEADATVWTPTAEEPVLDGTVTMQPDGLSLTVGTPWADGTAQVGQPLTVRPGVWGPTGVALAYQWVTYDASNTRAPIAGATGASFTPTEGQAGKRLAVEISGTLQGFHSHTTGFSVGTVGGTTPTMTGALTISGTPMPGQTLTAVPGALFPDGVNLSYDWYVNGKRVRSDEDGDASTLDLTPAMAGGIVEVDLTAYDWDCCTDQLYASAHTTVGGGVNGAKPTVSGDALVGSTLTASAGSWDPSGVSLAYQWYRAGTPIEDATTSTYTLTSAEVGAKLTVAVTGTLTGGYPPVTEVSEPTAAVQGVLTTATPTISGDAVVGSTLTAHAGDWGPSGVSLAYQWFAAGSAITDATGSTFVPTAAEIGKAITVKVTGTLDDYVTDAKNSAPTAAVIGVLTAATPTISGDALVGSTLTADPGQWGPDGVSLAYQWFAAGSAITDATGSTFVPTAAEMGKALTVKVTGTLAGYPDETTSSAPTSAVLNVFTAPPTPAVRGTAAVGNTLTADPGDWGADGVVLTYQWLRDDAPISDAIAATYTLTDADRGHTVSVRIVAQLDGYAQAQRTSAPTAVPGAAATTPPPTSNPTAPTTTSFAKSPAPKIAGLAKVGRKLTAKLGKWSPKPSFTYQWFRGGKAIKHATHETYKLTKADGGKRITVRVTASRTGYVTITETSAATKPVAR